MTEVQQNGGDSEQEMAISQRLADKLSELAYQEQEAEQQVVELREGETLFEQGDEGQSLYVVKAGVLGVRIRHADGSESDIARLAPGAIVGEMALLSGSRRSATVFALNDAGLIRVTGEQFQQLMDEDETALAAVSATAIPRWQRQQTLEALRALLGDVDAASLDDLRRHMTWHYFANGDVIFRQGESSDGMYIVVNGRLRATLVQEDGSEMDLGQLGVGEPVGEMGVLTDDPRSATVHAVRESYLVQITAPKFRLLIRQYPDLMINIARVIVERQRRLMQGSEQEQMGSLTLAVIPAGVDIDAALFAQELGRSLGQYGSTLALNSDAFDEAYGEVMASQTELDDVGNTAIVAWMTELDMSEQFVLYVADPFPSPWTRRCIAHADMALIIADPAGDPQPGEAEQTLDGLEIALPRGLVFWHGPQADSAQDVSAWLEPRHTEAYHFVAQGDEGQMDLFAERLAG